MLVLQGLIIKERLMGDKQMGEKQMGEKQIRENAGGGAPAPSPRPPPFSWGGCRPPTPCDNYNYVLENLQKIIIIMIIGPIHGAFLSAAACV